MKPEIKQISEEEHKAFDLYAAHAMQALIVANHGQGVEEEFIAEMATIYAVFLVGKRAEGFETIVLVKACERSEN